MSYKEGRKSKNIVSEPMALYVTQSSGSLFAGLFGSADRSAAAMSDFDLLQRTRNGLPKRLLLSLAKKISLTFQEFADILHISERTLQRYDDDTIIKTEYTEKAVELARLYTRGGEVFGSIDKFKTWMRTPLLVFHGETPLSLLDTSLGFDLVFKELGRIEHGIFA
ncbi:MAG TPA: antitoxin Xre/MbcA/ParS toxin-binding domain-containing protein [Mucilaginibacter sp.]|nr:antitoxin Xre/MbcA/ParS toxin-binding domain-containing protein [Mucilaginibacter sp.]